MNEHLKDDLVEDMINESTEEYLAMNYDINTHGDFQRLYDTKRKRNFWLLGYFGGGSVGIVETMKLAKQFSLLVGVPVESVRIDEVLYSQSYKHFKFLFSDEENQNPEFGSTHYDNVMEMLHR